MTEIKRTSVFDQYRDEVKQALLQLELADPLLIPALVTLINNTRALTDVHHQSTKQILSEILSDMPRQS